MIKEVISHTLHSQVPPTLKGTRLYKDVGH